MQWEYACLVEKEFLVDTSKPVGPSTWEWDRKFYFHGPSGTISPEGKSTIEILNQLGRESWEALSVEPRYAYFHENYGKYGYVVAGTVLGERQKEVHTDTETLVERIIWLRRPINSGAR